MSEDNFQWTDQTVAEFIRSLRRQAASVNEDGSRNFETEEALISKFKASKTPVKDYEILQVRHKNTNEIMGNGNIVIAPNAMKLWDIYSVKRLSDGLVFSVDETTANGNIRKIYIEQGRLIIEMPPVGENTFGRCFNINELKKEKPILFRTEDNVPIYEGDEIWMVFTAPGGIGNPGITKATKGLLPLKSYQKTFSTKEAVYEWLLLNKPCLSVANILSISSHYQNAPTYDYLIFSKEILMELAKQKLSQ